MAADLANEFAEYVRSRPHQVQNLMRDWPPFATVRARPGVVLLVPAPGVEGVVASYFEDGNIGIEAPMTIPHRTHGFGDASPGEVLRAPVDPSMLELVRESEWTRAHVETALAEPTKGTK